MAKVLNIKDCGYKVPNGAIYVGRAVPRYNLSSKWGNPFTVRDPLLPHGLSKKDKHKLVVDEYKSYLLDNPCLLAHLSDLRGKDLACWCHTWDGKGENPRYCHADILLELANQEVDNVIHNKTEAQ
ncbi:hypothetical protein LCGC14_1050040 [marine sediment metagenome]|uniref:DUF4326 domain-containing protein n=1 Tax=marine sediment metagenome TaxID=412755 RepID=A0A0F9QV42_9ZZZZ